MASTKAKESMEYGSLPNNLPNIGLPRTGMKQAKSSSHLTRIVDARAEMRVAGDRLEALSHVGVTVPAPRRVAAYVPELLASGRAGTPGSLRKEMAQKGQHASRNQRSQLLTEAGSRGPSESLLMQRTMQLGSRVNIGEQFKTS